MQIKSYIIEQNISKLDKNINLFFGENLGLKNDFKKKLKNLNIKEKIIRLNQDDILNNNLLISEINNVSLFNEKKIFFIENVNDKILDLIIDVEKIISEQKIYLFSDILEKKSKLRTYFEKSESCSLIACYEDNEITIRQIIETRLSGFEGLNQQNKNIIFDNCNMNRVKLNNELDKIITLFHDRKIETEKLEKLLDTRINDNFNDIKDQALLGNSKKTNDLLSTTVIEPEKNMLYLNMINQRLNKLLDINKIEGANLEMKINKLKPPIFWKDKKNFIDQAKKWDNKKIKNLIKKTYGIEMILKSNGLINKECLIKKFIVDICYLANA